MSLNILVWVQRRALCPWYRCAFYHETGCYTAAAVVPAKDQFCHLPCSAQSSVKVYPVHLNINFLTCQEKSDFAHDHGYLKNIYVFAYVALFQLYENQCK